MSTDNDLRTRLHNAGTGEWVRRARFARTDETRDEMLRVSQLCVEALDEFDRLERERAEWAGVAAVRNRNIVLIAEERDRLRTAVVAAVAIAREAATEWDNDNDARVGKILLALAGHVKGYRADIDSIHAALRHTVDVSGES